ncbi:hypothetical protein FRC07_008590 [Ceratobasidium sp. 392]|nr:hypothetical protein FRC07_008590 [Ceratobasidium sp. 392]
MRSARMMYAEMFDGFDDGTAILPSIGVTQSGTPSDWYLRICGYASEALKGEKHLYEDLPRKELAEYWSTRPQYEEQQQEEPPGSLSSVGASASAGPSAGVAGSSGGGGSGGGSSGGASLAPARAPTRNLTADFGDAPPPYSLEPSTPTAANAGGGMFTAEPEDIPLAPGPSSSQAPYQSGRPSALAMNRTDSTHSAASGSVHSQQHRPGHIAVPDPNVNAVPIQTPTTYQAPSGYPGVGAGSNPSSPPAPNAPLQRPDSVTPANAYGRPPQHPVVSGRPPPVTSTTRPPARPQSSASGTSNHSSPPSSYPPLPTPGSVHQLTDQMQGMNVGGPSRPAPEHAFAGVGLGGPPRPVMPGTPASPFEGVNMPGRPGVQGAGPGLFGPQPPLPPRHASQHGFEYTPPHPQTPSTPGSIPGSPFYPAPLQHGHGPTHQATLGPTHQHTMGPTHQHTLGPAHQGTIGPGQNYPAPAHQATLGPSPQPPQQPGQPPRPGQQPPQPSFQPSGPYVPHHQATGHYQPQTPPQHPQHPQQGYFGPSGQPPPHAAGYQTPGPQQPGGYPGPQQPAGGWHSPQPQHGGPSGSAGHSPQPQPGAPLHPGGHPGSGGYPPHMGGQPPPPGQGPYSGYGQYPPGGPQHPGARPGMPGAQYVDSALGVVGKYAGEDTKKKLEAGVSGAFNVDLVGVPVVLLYGLPQNKILLVTGWLGLRVALTGIRYLESRGTTKLPTSIVTILQSKPEPVSDPVVSSAILSEVEPAVPLSPEDLEVSTCSPAPTQAESIQELSESIVVVEFPRIMAEPDLEETAAADVNTRVCRTVSMSSTSSNTTVESNASLDSNMTLESECLTTPPQALVELPVESDNSDESQLTPKPDTPGFNIYPDDSPNEMVNSYMSRGQILDPDAGPVETSSPKRRSLTRKKSTKLSSSFPLLAPKRSKPSLQLSDVKYDKPAKFTA